jgi:hypothetical protein
VKREEKCNYEQKKTEGRISTSSPNSNIIITYKSSGWQDISLRCMAQDDFIMDQAAIATYQEK